MYVCLCVWGGGVYVGVSRWCGCVVGVGVCVWVCGCACVYVCVYVHVCGMKESTYYTKIKTYYFFSLSCIHTNFKTIS